MKLHQNGIFHIKAKTERAKLTWPNSKWENAGIIEPSHAKALREAAAHPEWFDLSDRTIVLFGAASEAGPLPWLAKWEANIVAIDLPNPRGLGENSKYNPARKRNAYCTKYWKIDSSAKASALRDKLGANLLTQIPEIAQWLVQFQKLDLAAIAYLDGETCPCFYGNGQYYNMWVNINLIPA